MSGASSPAEPDLFGYRHTQKGPWHFLLHGFAALLLTVGIFNQNEPVAAFVLPLSGVLMFILGTSFHHLTVADEGRQLAIHFGPLPLFRRRIWYDDIREVERGRTTFLDGWGIHMSLRGGWVWNIWGYDCVVFRLNQSTLRLGTDDPDNLVRFVRSRIARTSSPPTVT
jgi:hypothetical protein